MEYLENLQNYLFWLICGFIVFAYFLPSLSSFIKEKLTGKVQQENFDLDQMVHRKQEVFDKQAQSYRYAFEKNVFSSDDQKSIELLKEITWGEGATAAELLDLAHQSFPERSFTWPKLRSSYFELLKIEKFNQSDRYLAFSSLCHMLIHFSIKTSSLELPEQKEQAFLELDQEMGPNILCPPEINNKA